MFLRWAGLPPVEPYRPTLSVPSPNQRPTGSPKERHAGDARAKLYAADARIVIFGGETLDGRAAIEHYEIELLAQFPCYAVRQQNQPFSTTSPQRNLELGHLR